MNEDVDVVIWAAKAGANFLQQISAALETYKATGKLPDDMAANMKLAAAVAAGPKKRGAKKQPKLNKDGTEKQPRKPSAYNAWMQGKLKELKEAEDHDPNQKQVDTFKQAAQIWAGMPDDEKKAYTEEYKEKHKDDIAGSNGNGAVAAAVAADEESSDEEDNPPAAAPKPVGSWTSADSSSDEEETKPTPAPKPTPKPAPPVEEPARKKKKRKEQAAAAAPAATPVASPPDGEKKKKKKKKSLAE